MERYYAAHNTPIFLGYVGESGSREIAFDVSGWAGRGGTIQLMARRPGEETLYPVHLREDGNYVVWTVRRGDVALAGQNGMCQLSLADSEGRVLKSGSWITYVYLPLGGSAGTPAGAEQGWLDAWRAEVAGLEELAGRTEECAAFAAAAVKREDYDAAWMEEFRALAQSARQSAREANAAWARAKQILEQIKLLGGSGTAFEAVRALLKRAVYTENVSGWMEQLDALEEDDSSGDTGSDSGSDTGGDSGGDSGEADVTIVSISAVYSGGEVPAGTALSALLLSLAVTASWSDGSLSFVDGYELTGSDPIVEGENVITVSYGGVTDTFTVMGAAGDSGEDDGAADSGSGVTGDGHLTLSAAAADDGTGHLTVSGLTASDNGSGSITVS